jgi:hypothetical protein
MKLCHSWVEDQPPIALSLRFNRTRSCDTAPCTESTLNPFAIVCLASTKTSLYVLQILELITHHLKKRGKHGLVVRPFP